MAPAPSIAALFSRFARLRPRSPRPSQISSEELGRLGEVLAARHLRKHGYRVLYRNFRGPHGGEVDLVCRDMAAKLLVFVEVKTRRSTAFGQPGEAVNQDKQRLISRGALAWLRLLGHPEIHFRFDIVEVLFAGDTPSINIIANAFTLPEHYVY